MTDTPDIETFTGTVTELDVGGHGANSAQLEFSLTPPKREGEPMTFLVEGGTLPQVFASMTMLLTAAFVGGLVITISYLPQANGARPVATNIKLGAPSGGRKASRVGFV